MATVTAEAPERRPQASGPDPASLCTICCEVPAAPDRCVVPPCGHAFCVDCVLSWSAVRSLCPNCKTPFETLRVTRDAATGASLPHAGGQEVDVQILRTAPWVTIHELEPVVEDIASAFHVARISVEETQREVERASLLTGVRTFACEEAEDVFEATFWEQESRRYDGYEGDPYDDGVAAEPRRRLGNRRHGTNGYMASGRMVATPVVGGAGSSCSEEASSSSTPVTRKVVSTAQPDSTPVERQRKPPSSGGKRKKKVKKKSRAAALAASDDMEETETTAAEAELSANGEMDEASPRELDVSAQECSSSSCLPTVDSGA